MSSEPFTMLPRNTASATPVFAQVLARHRALHDLTKPLVLADYRHALDVWQWVLRLAPSSGLEVQVAALFHDVERLVSEPLVRVEQHAADYQAFKDAHAREGAALTRSALEGLFAGEVLARVGALVAEHERPGADPELALLNDADALSFFGLNSAGFWDYYGPDHTRKKVHYTLARLRLERRPLLDGMALRPEVRALLQEQLPTLPARGPS